jgi:hypothetical protein
MLALEVNRYGTAIPVLILSSNNVNELISAYLSPISYCLLTIIIWIRVVDTH